MKHLSLFRRSWKFAAAKAFRGPSSQHEEHFTFNAMGTPSSAQHGEGSSTLPKQQTRNRTHPHLPAVSRIVQVLTQQRNSKTGKQKAMCNVQWGIPVPWILLVPMPPVAPVMVTIRCRNVVRDNIY